MLSLEKLHYSSKTIQLACEIDEFKGRWRALEDHTTALQLLGDFSDYGHNFRSILQHWHEKELNSDVICKIHHAFALDKEDSGQIRSKYFPLIVQKGQKIVGTLETESPDNVQELFDVVTGWLDTYLRKNAAHPLIVIGVFMALFLRACPFAKGNQKLSRILVLMLMIRHGYDYAPFMPMEPIFEERAQEMFDALQPTFQSIEDVRPDFSGWLEFFLETLAMHKRQLEKRMAGKPEVLAKLPPLSSKIMKLFEKHQSLQMREIMKATRANRSTLKLRLGELVDAGYLKRHGKGAGVRYSLI